MGNKAERILESIRHNAGEDTHREILAQYGEIGENPTPRKQAQYVEQVLDGLSQHCDEETIARVMEACGRDCFGKEAAKVARTIYLESTDMQDFLNRLNQRHFGGGKLHIEGDVVVGIYDSCYCSLVKQAKHLLPNYCHCSVGWFKALFSSALGRDVDVRKRETILEGANACVFEIGAL